MRLKTLHDDGSITLEEYTDMECSAIFTERNSYVLECVHSCGKDYGGSQCRESEETGFEEIVPERILVKDNHFCGALLLTEYNGVYADAILLTEGNNARARDGVHFSNDDHDRWDYTDYYLVSRPDGI